MSDLQKRHSRPLLSHAAPVSQAPSQGFHQNLGIGSVPPLHTGRPFPMPASPATMKSVWKHRWSSGLFIKLIKSSGETQVCSLPTILVLIGKNRPQRIFRQTNTLLFVVCFLTTVLNPLTLLGCCFMVLRRRISEPRGWPRKREFILSYSLRYLYAAFLASGNPWWLTTSRLKLAG